MSMNWKLVISLNGRPTFNTINLKKQGRYSGSLITKNKKFLVPKLWKRNTKANSTHNQPGGIALNRRANTINKPTDIILENLAFSYSGKTYPSFWVLFKYENKSPTNHTSCLSQQQWQTLAVSKTLWEKETFNF